MTPIRHTIIGLPSSGKTTFLAALWHLLDAGEVSSKFVLDKLEGDRTHLNTIAEAWRKCEEVPRTSMAAETTVSIHVKETTSGKTSILNFPDLSGESFELQFSSRLCSPSFIDGLDGNGGILLFTTANRSSDGITIADIAPLIPIEGLEDQFEDHRDWVPEMVPMQVRLVELLQFLQQLPFRRGIRRVAVIVSAWDVIKSPDINPLLWLEQELPLLHQFLSSNPESFLFQVYGVSAQGGDVTSDQKNELVIKTPSTRICCVGIETTQHDLTSPIAWLMSSE